MKYWAKSERGIIQQTREPIVYIAFYTFAKFFRAPVALLETSRISSPAMRPWCDATKYGLGEEGTQAGLGVRKATFDDKPRVVIW